MDQPETTSTSDAETALRRHLVWRKTMQSMDDDASLLKWLRRLCRIGADVRTPLERRVQQRLEGRPVEPVTRVQQRMG